MPKAPKTSADCKWSLETHHPVLGVSLALELSIWVITHRKTKTTGPV